MNQETIKFAIDEKSLFYGCKNDFERGHTATVSTPINQSMDPKKWHNDILSLIGTTAEVKRNDVPKRMIDQCQRSSKSGNIITNVFVFNNIYVDGKKLNINKQFIMYIKQEIDENIKNKYGKMVPNTHLGRKKLHYPISFLYKTDGYNIDNEGILKEILTENMYYAYMVRGFEYNLLNKTLNIITSLIGPENVLLTTVFRVAKGAGQKLRTNYTRLTIEDINVNNIKGEDEDIVDDKFLKRSKTSQYNGKKGEDFVFDLLLNEDKEAYHTSVDYPTSPYDMEYINSEGTKTYVEVKSTQSDRVCFRMSKYEYEFMTKYKDQYILYMVMNVKEEFPKYKIFTYKDIMNLRKEITNYQFTKI